MQTVQELIRYCLDKKGRIFAQLFKLNGIDVVTFNCDPLTVYIQNSL